MCDKKVLLSLIQAQIYEKRPESVLGTHQNGLKISKIGFVCEGE